MKNNNTSFYFHPAGWPFIALFVGVTLLLSFIGGAAFFVGLVLTGWCFYFFRNPALNSATTFVSSASFGVRG